MAAPDGHRPPIGAHRALGQGRGAALIRPNGEIDWWCPNRFEATPVLWSLLDADGATARWRDAQIATWDGTPAGSTARTHVRIDGTLVDLWDGLLTVDGGTMLVRLARLARTPDEAGSEAHVALTHDLALGGFDGPWVPWEKSDAHFRIVGGGLHDVEWDPDHDRLVTTVDAIAHRWRGFAILAVEEPIGATAPELSETDLVAAMDAAEERDRAAMERVQLPHDHPSRVTDALKVLDVMTDDRTGAPVAALTTSLPEAPGGTRQFDYRYSWLRDSANGVAAAALLGHPSASERYLDFVARQLEREGDHLRPLATAAGDPPPSERQVAGVRGWAGSTPIRVGNDAGEQRQLDSLTAVIEAVWVHLTHGGRMLSSSWRIVDRMASRLAAAPRAPTSGVWELRDPALLVSEEIARWTGLDKALAIKRSLRPWARRDEWKAERNAARARIEAAVDPATGLLPMTFGGPTAAGAPVDAAALLLATNGFWRRRDPRLARLVRATVAALEEGSFLRRYPPDAIEDGFVGREATFVPAAWWAVSALCAIGDDEAARARADDMCAHLPPLVPEQWSVERNEAVGNTPLLWSHTEAARALYRLHDARVRRRLRLPGYAVWRVSRFVRLRAAGRRDPRHKPVTP